MHGGGGLCVCVCVCVCALSWSVFPKPKELLMRCLIHKCSKISALPFEVLSNVHVLTTACIYIHVNSGDFVLKRGVCTRFDLIFS